MVNSILNQKTGRVLAGPAGPSTTALYMYIQNQSIRAKARLYVHQGHELCCYLTKEDINFVEN